jgi:hypothetical protein
LVARTAGMSAENRVTPSPTINPSTTPVVASSGEVEGSPKPAASKRELMPIAIRRPAKMPITEPMPAVASASNSTLIRICRRLAPSVRSIAISRMRCATVIENMLKMMKAPTSTATPPNASSAGPRKPLMSSAMPCESSLAFSVPVCTLKRLPSRARTRLRNSVFDTPGAACRLTCVYAPARPYQRCASFTGIEVTSAPPSDAVVPMR